MNPRPVTLIGRAVRLEPLGPEHAADLLIAAAHDEIWTYLDEPTPRTRDEVEKMIAEAARERDAGERLPFAIVVTDTGQAVGSISYIDINPTHRSLEIGWGWLTPSMWGQGLTTEAAYLMLRHAFEELGAVRVAFKADARNERSQRAIHGMGATREGVFRNHRILSDGTLRHSAYFSVIESEWPRIRTTLENKIASATSRL